MSRTRVGSLAAASALAACVGCGGGLDPEQLDPPSFTTLEQDSRRHDPRRNESIEYLDCDEFAGVGVVPSETVAERLPSDFVLLEPEAGLALVVAQGARCREIRVPGSPPRPGVFAQLGVGVIPPLGTGDGNFYQLMFSSTHPGVVRTLRAAGANAVFSRRLSYSISAEAELELTVPRPAGLAWRLDGPLALPDPSSEPAPLTTFNYWHRSERFGNVLQANAVTNIRLGSGAGVALTALGEELEAIVGSEPFFFPFFSNPETFERAELTITRDAF